ncbi:MAG: right-handed parallel beta-helix repeat-containing protein [Steroidobacteraceae bacterium]
MSDRKRPKTRETADRTTSRREILRIGTALIPAGIFLPAWLTAAAQTSSSFDFYISTTGSDSNPGTLSQPWAITSLINASQNAYNAANWTKMSGKRIGLLPGTYNVSAYMKPSSWTGALQLPGGTSSASTYLASSDSSGQYSRGTATITALSSGGIYGGFAGYAYNGPILANTGYTYTGGYLTIDGVSFTGYSYKGVRIGGASASDGPANLPNVIIQNCEFYGGKANPGTTSDNCSSLWIDGCVSALVTNNYFHDFVGSDPEHTAGLIAFTCQQCIVQYNTFVNTGCVYGKIGGNQGNIVRYNYIDGSTESGSPAGMYGILDWSGDFGTEGTVQVVQPSYIYNNIVLSDSFGIALFNTSSYAYGWICPVYCYNNTIVLTPASGTNVYPAIWIVSEKAYVTRGIRCYNNIYSGAADRSGYMSFVTNPTGPAIWDYNMYIPSGMSWALRADSGLDTVLGTYTTASAFGAAIAANGGISGVESHSIAGAPTFTKTGTLAQLYQLASGSAGKGAGRVGGVTSGAACDMGAWGNGATQIGCNFTSGAAAPAVPMAPTLSVS